MLAMKVAVSLPDPVFKAADLLARKLHKSRSQVYAEALTAYVGTHCADAVREQLNAVYAIEESKVDPVLYELQLQTLDPNETW